MRHILTGVGLGLVLLTGWLLLSVSGHELLATATLAEGNLGADAGAGVPDTQAVGLPQRIRPVDLSGPFTFAGEVIPVDNFDIRERLDREILRNAYFHRSTLLLLKRMPRYFPTIERILAEEGIPKDFKYLAVAESALANATSAAGAKGVWQFMTPTGRSFGLEINGQVDERYHLEKATRAACAYLKGYYRQFDDWRSVAAAYNMGGPNLKKWLARQRAETVFDLDINAETMAYVFRIVALKTILENPEDFGYYLEPNETYPPLSGYRTVTVTESIANLGDFAQEQGTSYRLLKVYNPWLTSGALTVGRGKSYALRIPTP